ncbi:MAG: PEP-CTERM sorting domain-containing protein [Akkermansiaceae bacterium]
MKKSLGSLSAIAALCAMAGPVDAAVVVSTSINNEVIINTSTTPSDYVDWVYDVNGDGKNDLGFFSNSATMVLYHNPTLLQNETLFITSSSSPNVLRSFNFGELVDVTTIPTSNLAFDSSPSAFQNGTVYMAFLFDAGLGDYHAGFLEFEVSLDGSNSGVFDKSGDSVTLVSATWETLSNASITVGSVPEPSTALLTLGGLAGAAFLRRRPLSVTISQ